MKVENVKKLLKGVRKKRPVLACINYNSDTQLISICDSYAIVQEKSRIQINETFNLNVFDLQLSRDKYPELENIKKPSHNFESIDNIEIIVVDNKMYYKINNNDSVIFDRTLVDNSFKCLTNIAESKNKYVSLENINNEYIGIDKNVKLIYHNRDNDDFVLVLGRIYRESEEA